MVLVDCAIQNGSVEMVTQRQITNNMCTNGILTQFGAIRSEFTESLPPQPSSDSNSSDSSSSEIKYFKYIPSLPPLPNLPQIKPKAFQYVKSSGYFPSAELHHKVNSSRLKVPSKFIKSSIQVSKRAENLALKPTSCYSVIASPPSKRIKPMVKALGSRYKENLQLVFENRRLCLVTTRANDQTGKITLRRWVSEPCFAVENKTNENPQYKRRHSEKFSFDENTPSFKLFDIPTPKKTLAPKMTNGRSSTSNSKSRNTSKNPQKTPSKSSTAATNSKNGTLKLARPSILEPKKPENNIVGRVHTRRKTNQGTQVEQTTKEVESQTDFNQEAKDRPVPRKKQSTPSTDDKKSKEGMKKTVIAPFSFMDRVQALLERKEKRKNKIDKTYEIKRWARPPLILKKKPFKLSSMEKKITVPEPMKFETDLRRQKWEEFMREFNQRQQEQEKEKETIKQKEMTNFRKTLIPKIHTVPYKKLGIKPRKRLVSQFRKLREHSTKMAEFNYSSEDDLNGNKTRSGDRAKFAKVKKSNRNESTFKIKRNSHMISTQNEFNSNYKNFSKKNKNSNSPNDKMLSITQKISIKEKNNSNVKNSRMSSSDENNTVKTSFQNRNESRRNFSTSIKNSSRSNSYSVKDDFDGLYEKNATASINSKQQFKVAPAVKTQRKVF
ncbi:probable serine/threonine-protein kinase tsuA [Planococcus citri]|uniref:probable serine/threonine-protein kinase tsuA n=1 Tax=Planococcus citri TaxID=170843 RepID=UPI0031F9555B